MNVWQAAGLAVGCALGGMALRRMRPEIGMAAALAGGSLLLGLAMPALKQLAEGLAALGQMGDIPSGMLSQLMKVAGVSLLMDFAAQTCRDAGEGGLAMKTELAGRCMLLTLAIPPLKAVLAQVLSLPA